MREPQNIIQRLDKPMLVLYLLMLLVGLMTVFAVNYNEESSRFFNLSQTHGRQMTWMFISLVLGFSMLTFNSNFFTKFSIPFYIIIILLLLVTLAVAREINGARSWLQIGPAQFQPAEFAKTATALMLAKYISSLSNAVKTFRQKMIAAGIILLPMAIIILQEDMGSALVYTSLSLVLYREGFKVREVIIALLFGAGFILSMLVSVQVLLWVLSGVVLLIAAFSSGRLWRKDKPRYLRYWLLFLLSVASFAAGYYLPALRIYLIVLAVLFMAGVWMALRPVVYMRITPVFWLYLALTGFTLYGSSFVMNELLESHQSERVLTLLGLSDDPDANYNVTQSKMTIGSGGFAGKGYLEGTLTQLKHVPEQSTDFIFCTIGEELGFLGTFFFLAIYLAFILRIIHLAERQRSPFTRIYCYSVASIFFIQVMINVGMTIGLLPVIGIPLPFISYGGSSVLAFSIMVFIVLRLDADRLLILR
ncbi:MAG TPA: rod shape-determining protein RodA [Chitinophagales bacterium]|nr:rod shape-determining protein RodA [Chitinophagales bacterium]